jgi:hypothetical protein
MTQQLHHRLNGTGFGIVRAVNEAVDPGMHDGAGAHGARFNCNKQVASGEAMVAERGTGFAQGYDFSVSGGIVVGDVAVPSAADDALIMDDYGSDGDFSGFEGALGGAQGFLHPEFVVISLSLIGLFLLNAHRKDPHAEYH